MNQIAVANLMMNLKMNNSKTIDESMVRHMILNSIRMYRMEHHDEYGEVVLTWDSKHSWRRDYYPEYKASRRKGREESDLNWDDIFGTLNKIRNEIKENFPYKYLEVFGAEADDIIATICNVHGSFLAREDDEKILILSSDKDFMQLQKYVNVDQWSPSQDKFLHIRQYQMRMLRVYTDTCPHKAFLWSIPKLVFQHHLVLLRHTAYGTAIWYQPLHT